MLPLLLIPVSCACLSQWHCPSWTNAIQAACLLLWQLLVCRALTYFRGEPDPFKGDVPNQKVRDMAKEALDAVFAAVDLNAAPSSAPLQVTSISFTIMLN